MSSYDEQPWLALYREQPADPTVDFDDALDMSAPGWRGNPMESRSGTSMAASPVGSRTSSATP